MGPRMASRLRSSTAVTLLLSTFGIATGASTACDGSAKATEAGPSGAPAPQGEADAGTTDEPSCKTTFPVTQPLSAPCCTEWGIDGCGAGLFCAALDGRTQATCYPVRSRRHRETCLADDNCVSEHCDADTKTCNLRPGTSCNPGDPCARDENGVPHTCLESRCTPTPCDPIRQTGCAESETCDLVGETAGCRKVGPSKLGESCYGLAGLPCARGLTCGGTCSRICSTEADCPNRMSCHRSGPNPFGFCTN